MKDKNNPSLVELGHASGGFAFWPSAVLGLQEIHHKIVKPTYHKVVKPTYKELKKGLKGKHNPRAWRMPFAEWITIAPKDKRVEKYRNYVRRFNRSKGVFEWIPVEITSGNPLEGQDEYGTEAQRRAYYLELMNYLGPGERVPILDGTRFLYRSPVENNLYIVQSSYNDNTSGGARREVADYLARLPLPESNPGLLATIGGTAVGSAVGTIIGRAVNYGLDEADILESDENPDSYGSTLRGRRRFELGSEQDRFLHARDLPHTHVHFEGERKVYKRYGTDTLESENPVMNNLYFVDVYRGRELVSQGGVEAESVKAALRKARAAFRETGESTKGLKFKIARNPQAGNYYAPEGKARWKAEIFISGTGLITVATAETRQEVIRRAQRAVKPEFYRDIQYSEVAQAEANAYKYTTKTPLHVHDYEREYLSGLEGEVTDYWRGKRGKGAHPRVAPTPRPSRNPAQRDIMLRAFEIFERDGVEGYPNEIEDTAWELSDEFFDGRDLQRAAELAWISWRAYERRNDEQLQHALRELGPDEGREDLERLVRKLEAEENPRYRVSVSVPAVSESTERQALTSATAMLRGRGELKRKVKASAKHAKYAVERINPQQGYMVVLRWRRGGAEYLRNLTKERAEEIAEKWRAVYGNTVASVTVRPDPLAKRNGTQPNGTRSVLRKFSKMFHGESNYKQHAGDTENTIVSNHVRANHFARLGGLPYIKLVSGAKLGARHNPPKHRCSECTIEFNPNTTRLGATAGKKLVIYGNGAWAVGKQKRREAVRANPGTDNEIFDLGAIDVLPYITEEKHEDSGAMIRYYHPCAEESGREEEKPHLYLDEEGMLFIPQTGEHSGNYTITEDGIIN